MALEVRDQYFDGARRGLFSDVMNRFGTLLYDVVADPQQQNPIDDAEQEQRLLSAMVEMMTEMDAPPEQYERLGIELQPR